MKLLTMLVLLLFFIPISFAHGESEDHTHGEREHSVFWDKQMEVVGYGTILFGILVALTMVFKKSFREHHKKLLFITLTVVISLITLYSAADTLHTNITSETNGPVHWHTDYEIWNCGVRLDLINPTGFSNKVGTPLFHEHNDDRIHLEGAIPHLDEVTLEDYFHVVGGELTNTGFIYPTEDRGVVTVNNGDTCNGERGELQIWLYRIQNPRDTKDWNYELVKIDGASYTSAPYGNIPPGDCLIIEFDNTPEETEKICAFYQSHIDRGELRAS